MLGVEAVAEGMADELVGHHPGVPRLGQTQQSFVAAGCLVHAGHDAIMTEVREVLGGCGEG